MTELGMLFFYYYSAFSYSAVVLHLCRYFGVDRTNGWRAPAYTGMTV